ncbi:MAG: response regulator [Planctomycetes bacterium]|nr:response regulator [Planctomycetota bacterium]
MSVKKRVMLVDDDADFVEMNKAVLEQNGYEVEVAYNAKECLEKALANEPDLIVLDAMMSGSADGFNVSCDLRNFERTKQIPLIMVTAINETLPFRFKPDATWLPVDMLIEKPVRPEQLLQVIKRALAQTQA